ncbi:hypothetical protein TNCT_170221 [Trichonephila clavata]|uniref:Uncharacterized protein n=1 Tax=Trichonephila clavata TaxID=2740835 RepID=A0A8X6JYQ3_TRICU|nr:hypothetical protein TNCT_170221 [Trichonephila clavata]
MRPHSICSILVVSNLSGTHSALLAGGWALAGSLVETNFALAFQNFLRWAQYLSYTPPFLYATFIGSVSTFSGTHSPLLAGGWALCSWNEALIGRILLILYLYLKEMYSSKSTRMAVVSLFVSVSSKSRLEQIT